MTDSSSITSTLPASAAAATACPATIDNAQVSEQKVQTLASSINFDDPTLTVTYGTQTMNEIAHFADSLLDKVRVKDSGAVGESLSALMDKVKGIDITGIAKHEKGFLESLPLIGGLFNSLDRKIASFNTLLEQVEGVSSKLEEAMFSLLKDIQILEQLYANNKDFYCDLSACIEAGEKRLKEARETELAALSAKAAQTGSALDAQNVHDFSEKLNRFERRLHDLKLSRTITLQTAPQIRMIQNNNQTLAEKIQTSILSTIPIWKNQMVLALSIQGQKNAAQLQKDVADTTNAMLRTNADMLQQATVETAQEVERSIIDVETLRDVQNKLVASITETMNITQQGRQRRMEVEKELIQMESDLKTQLAGLAQQKVQQDIGHQLEQTKA